MSWIRYELKDKKEKPQFLYYVKENTHCHNYYLFNDYERAMDKARILSLTRFPCAIIREPVKDEYGEWHLEQTHIFYSGECYYDNNRISFPLHAKFYLDAGQWLNPEELGR